MTLEDGKEALIIAQKNALYDHQRKAYQFGVDIISQIIADQAKAENHSKALAKVEKTSIKQKSFREKNCDTCGLPFTPYYARQKTCGDCMGKAAKE